MTFTGGTEAGEWLQQAIREPLLPLASRDRGPWRGREEIEALLPHRDPLLLIDRITHVDAAGGFIACRYDMERARPLLAGHFPGAGVWPGVLQVEAIGQAGLCLLRLIGAANGGGHGFHLTHILGAQFVRPVTPVADLEIVARVRVDGLFRVVLGQCLQRDVICCVAAVRGLEGG